MRESLAPIGASALIPSVLPAGTWGSSSFSNPVLEWYVDDVFDEVMLDAFFNEYLIAFHRFYKHTDEQALRGLAAKLKEDDRLRELWSDLEDEAWIGEFVRAVPEQYQSIMVDYLIDPEHIG